MTTVYSSINMFCKLSVIQESFRPSLSPTGDVFDDRKLDITSAIVSGFNAEKEESSNSESEGKKTDTVKKSPTMDENQPTEEKTTEEPVAEKVAEENDKAESEPEAEVKGRSSHSYTTIIIGILLCLIK